MKINRIALLLLSCSLLTSCVISTATKIVTTTAKIGYSAVKGTVKGVSWAVQKADGKIDKDRLNGSWKLVGVYNGTYEEFVQDKNPDNTYKNECGDSLEVIEFKSKKEKFLPIHCQSEQEDWIKYRFEFGKNPQTKNRENYLQYNSNNYITVIDVTGKTMVLEGKLMANHAFSGGALYLFEKVK